MHQQQQQFCLEIKDRYGEWFSDTVVVDFGSLDINGNNRYLFERVHYTGVDLGPGNNVDFIGRAHQYNPPAPVDVVISTEMLEHDEFWRESLRHAYGILKSGGMLLFTCAADPRWEHGTTRSSPGDAPFVGDYYRNLSEEDVKEVFDLEKEFSSVEMRTNRNPGDLYFCGVKV